MQTIEHPKASDAVDGDPPGRTPLKLDTDDGRSWHAFEVDDGLLTVPDDLTGTVMDHLESAYGVTYDRHSRRIDTEATSDESDGDGESDGDAENTEENS